MMAHEPVLTKVDFVRRYAAGEFGNAPQTWRSLEDFLGSGYRDAVHVRNGAAGGQTWYGVRAENVVRVWAEASASYDPSLLYISEMGPEDARLFQGEVSLGPWGHRLLYTTVCLPMREALRRWSQEVAGLRAKLLLDHFLRLRSREWLDHLLEEYPGHVVEFTTYDREWGTVPGFNTLFWEVRRY